MAEGYKGHTIEQLQAYHKVLFTVEEPTGLINPNYLLDQAKENVANLDRLGRVKGVEAVDVKDVDNNDDDLVVESV